MLRKLLIIAVLFGSVAATYAQKKDKKKKKDSDATAQAVDPNDTSINYRAIGAPMPKIYVHTLDSVKLTEKDFKNNGNLIVMCFNPTCDHCQTMTLAIEKDIDKFKKTEILLISAPSLVSYLDFFNNVTRHTKYPKIHVGVDSAGFINKTYEYGTLPQINVYDKNRKLVKVLHGQQTLDNILPYIE